MTAPASAATSVALIDLTDEELAALAGTDGSLVVSPYLDGLEEAARQQAVVSAFRSLVAHGLVQGPTAEAAAAARSAGGEVALEVRMSEPLAQALALRRAAGVVVCGQRTVADSTSWRYLHLVDDVVLDEVVELTGLHRFGLLRPADLPDVLLDWVAPEGWDGADGPSTQLGVDGRLPEPLLEQLGTATVVADLVVRREGDGGGGMLLGTFAGPDLLVLSTTRAAAGSVVTLRPLSRRTLRDVIAEQLEGAR